MTKPLNKSELQRLIDRLEHNLKLARACHLGVVISQQDVAIVIAILKREADHGA